MTINRVAVIGAGVMGAGIAAQVANAGVPVILLDVPSPDLPDRSAIAKKAIARMHKTDPQPLMHRRFAKLIEPGNLEDDFDRLAECDWIIEAVIERLDVKQGLFARIAGVRKADSIVSSNTSTIPLSRLTDGMQPALESHFMVTHFFNPPRYMRLFELLVSDATDASAVARIRSFADRRLGKGVVDCKDTPGFIANRIGTYWLQCAVTEAINQGIDVEHADAIMGRPVGIPKTGVFGLIDLVGLDLMPHILASMRENLPVGDAFLDYAEIPPLLDRMIATGYTGRKGKGGFYRLNRENGKKTKEVIDLDTGEYRSAVRPTVDGVKAAGSGNVRKLVEFDGAAGRYAWRVLAQTLSYAANLIPEIADNIEAVDQAMRLGFRWKYGPFELIDRLGADWFERRLAGDGLTVPALVSAAAAAGGFYRVDNLRTEYLVTEGVYSPVPRAEGVLLLADLKLRSKPLIGNHAASLWDIGDGVACLEFHTRMNALEPDSFDVIANSIAEVAKRYKALVVYNEGSNFSVGANIGLALFAANIAAWPLLESMVKMGQQTYKALKYAPFPVVGAPSGMALGGGCEILLHCDAVQAHAESYIGLVEVGVGLIPGWGGCKELLLRWDSAKQRMKGPMPPVVKSFEAISTATVAKSAAQAKDYQFLRPEDGITMNRDRLLADAKARALSMVAGYVPPEHADIRLPGPSAKVAMGMAVRDFRKRGLATEYDEVVADALSTVLSGADADITTPVTEEQLLTLERTQFMKLVRTAGTLRRVEHMLETGKPLRN